MMLILQFTLALLLICIAVLAMVFYHWRRYPILQEAINLKRPRWLALFISCGIGAISFGAASGINLISEYFRGGGPPNEVEGPFDRMVMFLLLPLIWVAIVCSFGAAVWCLCRLIAALLSHVYSLQSKQS